MCYVLNFEIQIDTLEALILRVNATFMWRTFTFNHFSFLLKIMLKWQMYFITYFQRNKKTSNPDFTLNWARLNEGITGWLCCFPQMKSGTFIERKSFIGAGTAVLLWKLSLCFSYRDKLKGDSEMTPHLIWMQWLYSRLQSRPTCCQARVWEHVPATRWIWWTGQSLFGNMHIWM